jgi:transcriptional regulator with XRE-family HTH domain
MRKFNVNTICNIRHAINIEGKSRSELARRYKVSSSTISDIVSGKTYQDVPTAKAIPGYSNYLAYPNGRVWSFNRNCFIKPMQKRESSKTRYITVRNRDSQKAFQVSQLVNSLF